MAPAIQAVQGRPLRLSCPECRKRGSVSGRQARAPAAMSPRTPGAWFLRGDDRAVPWRPWVVMRDRRVGTGSSWGQGGPALGPGSAPGMILLTCGPPSRGPDRCPRHHHDHHHHGRPSRPVPVLSRQLLPPGGTLLGSRQCFPPNSEQNSQGLGPLSMAAGSLPRSCAAPSRRHPASLLHTSTRSTSRPFQGPLLLLEAGPRCPRDQPLPPAASLPGPPLNVVLSSVAASPPSRASGMCDHTVPQERHLRSWLTQEGQHRAGPAPAPCPQGHALLTPRSFPPGVSGPTRASR